MPYNAHAAANEVAMLALKAVFPNVSITVDTLSEHIVVSNGTASFGVSREEVLDNLHKSRVPENFRKLIGPVP